VKLKIKHLNQKYPEILFQLKKDKGIYIFDKRSNQ
jgi:hypothetical protein